MKELKKRLKDVEQRQMRFEKSVEKRHAFLEEENKELKQTISKMLVKMQELEGKLR